VEKSKGDGTVDIGALWTLPEGKNLEGGRFSVELPKRKSVLATAAPGISNTEYLVTSTGKMQ
jgi:hypothetical protein